jgi:hypothetical protein
MKITSAITILALAAAPAIGAPVPAADIVARAPGYGSYGTYAPPAGGYGTYGSYSPPATPPAGGYTSYTTYGTYATYGTYKRAIVEFLSKLF